MRSSAVALERERRGQRTIAWIRGSRPGPLLICVGGLHGNEPAGVEALESVAERLRGRSGLLSGDFIALRGHVRALAEKKRFLQRDLNRAWTRRSVERLRARKVGGNDPLDPESSEQLALLALLEEANGKRRGDPHLLDIHSTSSAGGSFTSAGDRLANRRLALSIPVPFVVGIEEQIRGTLIGYCDSLGWTNAVFECGQHRERESVRQAETGILLVLSRIGMLAENEVPGLSEARRALRKSHARLPKVVSMSYRHAIEDKDRYRSKPTLANFQKVRAGDVVGWDARGEVRSPRSGRLLMPLFQKLGEDGFFVVRTLSPLWLYLSALARRLKLDGPAMRLPGVRRPSRVPGALIVDRRIARVGALAFFRLLGFRRVSDRGRWLIVRRSGPAPAALSKGRRRGA